ncbi:MAG: cytochrome c [Xanthomonadales bacterium]|nr:cytochrome c [Xanthomonadales bacterium]
MNETPWWSSESAWRKAAIWITSGMLVILILLTFDTVRQITAGSERVPGYGVINHKIFYEYNADRGYQTPRIGPEAPLFGERLDEAAAEELVTLGKLTVQAKNCMNCHTLLGNGAYYAPDLTKAWLDPGWIDESLREDLMVAFLQNPAANARTFGSNRRMPDLGITEQEARGIVAFLKWMSSIDTNGFPRGFTPLDQEDEQ